MKECILISLLFMPICGFYFYNDIEWITRICAANLFLIYAYIYKLSFNDIYFAISITPTTYIEPVQNSHKLVSYGFSTIHASFIALYSTLYLYDIFDNYDIKQAFFISMSYYLSDLFYIITSTNKLSKLDYFTICHHFVIIYYYNLVFLQTDPILENNLLFYLNRGFIAEYSLVSLNYSWYLINTKQDNGIKMIISLITTLVLYFITRILNFTVLLYGVWQDGLLLISIVVLPLVVINYFWFYKIIFKAFRVYKKKIRNTINTDKQR
jgi:hypothetical protein